MSVLSSVYRKVGTSGIIQLSRFGVATECYFLAFFSSGKQDVGSLLPKRPPSAFIRFSAEHRPLIRASQPNMKLPDISKLCARRWAEISPGKKEQYLLVAEREHATWKESKARLEADASLAGRIAEFKKQKSEARIKKAIRKAKRILDDTGRPKRPAPAFGWYLKDNIQAVRAKLVAGGVKPAPLEVMKAAVEAWKAESEDVKEKYVQLRNLQKEEYKIKVAAWKEQVASSEDLQKANEKLNRAKNQKKRLGSFRAPPS